MEMENSVEVPPPPRPAVVGLIYNLKKGIKTEAVDSEAEYDNIETVEAIQKALEKHGLNVVLLEADRTLPVKLSETPIDIAFNVAEGFGGRGREAQIPALLNIMGIPFTGSDETTLCVALDKALTKRILSSYKILSPKSVAVSENQVHGQFPRIKFPVIVKPNAEGSSKGIGEISIAKNADELRELLNRNLRLYQSDMLAEEYIEGREFTVGLLGNGKNVRVFSPMEIIINQPTQKEFYVYSYTVKQDFRRYVQYSCPAILDKTIESKMMKTAERIFNILGCRDFARVDFRLAQDGKIYFIEINPLPGLAPGYSDYPMLADFCGMPYEELVYSVYKAAADRLSLNQEL